MWTVISRLFYFEQQGRKCGMMLSPPLWVRTVPPRACWMDWAKWLWAHCVCFLLQGGHLGFLVEWVTWTNLVRASRDRVVGGCVDPQGSRYSCKLQNEDGVLRGQCAGLSLLLQLNGHWNWYVQKKCVQKKYHLAHHFYWILTRVTWDNVYKSAL